MLRLLADVDSEGQFAIVVGAAATGPWRDFWEFLDVTVHRFSDVSLPPASPDADVWQFCQDNGYFLITGNRNDDGPTSLQATLRDRNDLASLPVITLADTHRLRSDRQYVEAAAGKLIELLMEIDRYRGAGRLFVP